MTLERGWKARARAAVEKRADDNAERAAVRAERARYYEEQRALAQAQLAAAEQSHAETHVSCPCCDTGRITVERAELIIRALERLPSSSTPDQDVLGILQSVASRQPVHSRYSLPLRHGLAYPRAMDGGLAPKPAEITPRPEPISTPNRAPRAVKANPPWLDVDAVSEDDE